MVTPESIELHSEVMIWFSILTFNASQIFPSFRFSFSFPHIQNQSESREVAWHYRDYSTVEKTKTEGEKKRGGKVKMEWSFRGKGRQDGDMN